MMITTPLLVTTLLFCPKANKWWTPEYRKLKSSTWLLKRRNVGRSLKQTNLRSKKKWGRSKSTYRWCRNNLRRIEKWRLSSQWWHLMQTSWTLELILWSSSHHALQREDEVERGLIHHNYRMTAMYWSSLEIYKEQSKG